MVGGPLIPFASGVNIHSRRPVFGPGTMPETILYTLSFPETPSQRSAQLMEPPSINDLGWSMNILYLSTNGRVPRFWRPPLGDADNRIPLTDVFPGPQDPGLMILEHELSAQCVAVFTAVYPEIKAKWKINFAVRLINSNGAYRNAVEPTGAFTPAGSTDFKGQGPCTLAGSSDGAVTRTRSIALLGGLVGTIIPPIVNTIVYYLWHLSAHVHRFSNSFGTINTDSAVEISSANGSITLFNMKDPFADENAAATEEPRWRIPSTDLSLNTDLESEAHSNISSTPTERQLRLQVLSTHLQARIAELEEQTSQDQICATRITLL
ncbi:hypothetical protein C8J56DRAFT_1042551 [Mycena floridula]|nr:hypothetical protein C8J56DRAFT_1042551 [Mycena floridula]